MGSFSGKISLEEKPIKPLKPHKPIQPDMSDPRIDILREYISKAPNATIKNLKSALNHFSPPTDSEFKEIVKSANIDKYNELYPLIEFRVEPKDPKNVISTERIPAKSKYRDFEIQFMCSHIDMKPRHIYTLYKQKFPNSERNQTFVKDLRYLMKLAPEKYNIKIHMANPMSKSIIKHRITPNTPQIIQHSLVAQTIKSLYKAGFTPETLPKVKPVLNELISQNSNEEEIALAIAYLKN